MLSVAYSLFSRLLPSEGIPRTAKQAKPEKIEQSPNDEVSRFGDQIDLARGHNAVRPDADSTVQNAAVLRRGIPSDGRRRLNRLYTTDNMAYGRPCPAAITLIPQRTARRHETVIKPLLQGTAEETLVARTARRTNLVCATRLFI